MADEDTIVNASIPNWPDPPPVTNTNINRVNVAPVPNIIRTRIQPVVPNVPPTGAQVLNNAIPSPTSPLPVTSEQISGNGIQGASSSTASTARTSTRNEQVSGSANLDPSLNGDSNIVGGVARTQGSSLTGQSGGSPGTGTSAYSVFSPGLQTLVNAGAGTLNNGRSAISTLTNQISQQQSQSNGQKTQGSPINQGDAQGRRVRLRPKPGGESFVYSDSPILSQLKATSGMIWPYQPVITYQQEVDYKSMELTHANQDIYAYHRTPSLRLTVDGEFSVQNQTEGMYAFACIHFLRTVTKMNFGETDPRKGTPPPVLLFDAYGQYMFSQLPVIVTGFTVGLPKDVDYVPIDVNNTKLGAIPSVQWRDLTSTYLSSRSSGDIIWLPSVFNIQVSLIVQNSPTRLRTFDLGGFRNGSLLKQGGWV